MQARCYWSYTGHKHAFSLLPELAVQQGHQCEPCNHPGTTDSVVVYSSVHLLFFKHLPYGNPLQCSCLENPRDGGAWWAAVYGVAQSRTRLT